MRKLVGNVWKVFLNGGRVETEFEAIEWAKRGVELGAGEILLTSMNADGTKNGFEIELTQTVSEAVNVPVIASGGAGSVEHFTEVFENGKADAALAASIFHFREIEIPAFEKLSENAKYRELEFETNLWNLNFKKYADGLVPAIIQDAETQKVLMLGFMNRKAFKKNTKNPAKLHFIQRSRKKIWKKGETSGNFLDSQRNLV